MDLTAPEMVKAAHRARKENDRAIKAEGQGSSNRLLGLCETLIDDLTTFISKDLLEPHTGMVWAPAIPLIREKLDPRLIALCCLQSIFDELGATIVPMQTHCGLQLAMELFAAEYRQFDHKAAVQAEKLCQGRRSAKARYKAARMHGTKHGFSAKHWTNPQMQAVGMWMVGCVTQCFPDMFELNREVRDEYRLDLSAEGAVTAELLLQSKTLRPVHLPLEQQPPHWTAFECHSGNPKVDYQTQLVKTAYKRLISAHRQAIAKGGMQPALDAVNALQDVPWRINRYVYGVVQALRARKEFVPILRQNPVPSKPHWDPAWDKDKERYKAERKAYFSQTYKRREAQERNAQISCDFIQFTEDMDVAELFAGKSRFWLQYTLDWRGRVYACSNFNWAREDRVRGLFEFADGVPIGVEGLRWLKYHVATQGEFGKVNKKPIEERIAWTEKNIDLIQQAAQDPIGSTWWRQAENPFVFLAACRELVSALEVGPAFVTHLPISFDGACNGLQHLSLLSRDERTGGLVNLVANDQPSDVYTIIGEAARQRYLIDAQSDDEATRAIAAQCLKEDPRKLAKRNTMTFGYSSEAYGMAGQIQEDLIDRYENEVLDGKREANPFAPYHRKFKGGPSKAAYYIGKVNYDCIRERLPRPQAVMKYMQKVSDALAHQGMPVSWTTPMGMPWQNGKYETIARTMTLWSRIRGVRSTARIKVSEGFSQKILKDKSANGIAPNLVHALDAAHLMASVNACVKHGITSIATVHDSYSCLAPHAVRFNQIIREELVRMYEEHDPLQEIWERAHHDLTQPNWKRLPVLPERGQLDLKEIKDARYAFA